MTVFEKLTTSPEAMGNLLASLAVIDSPWENAFHKIFCAGCEMENCDAENCPHQAQRNNPAWWLALDVPTNADEAETHSRLADIHFDQANEKAEYLCHGKLEILQHFAQVCMFLQEQLWDHGKKFRVTIECDPEFQDFTMKRDSIN